MNKIETTLLGTTVLFGAVSFYLYSELRSERAQVAVASAARAELEKRATQTQARLTAAEVALAKSAAVASQPQPQPPPQAVASSRPTPTSMVNARPPLDEGAIKEIRQHAMRVTYGDLAAMLKLSKDQTERLFELMSNRLSVGTLNDEAFNAEMMAFLGAEKFDQYQEYQQHFVERRAVAQLRSDLAGARVPPLSDEQERRLYAALVQDRATYPMPSARDAPPGVSVQTLYRQWHEDHRSRIMSGAESILSPDQLAIFKGQQGPQLRFR